MGLNCKIFKVQFNKNNNRITELKIAWCIENRNCRSSKCLKLETTDVNPTCLDLKGDGFDVGGVDYAHDGLDVDRVDDTVWHLP